MQWSQLDVNKIQLENIITFTNQIDEYNCMLAKYVHISDSKPGTASKSTHQTWYCSSVLFQRWKTKCMQQILLAKSRFLNWWSEYTCALAWAEVFPRQWPRYAGVISGEISQYYKTLSWGWALTGLTSSGSFFLGCPEIYNNSLLDLFQPPVCEWEFSPTLAKHQAIANFSSWSWVYVYVAEKSHIYNSHCEKYVVPATFECEASVVTCRHLD